VGVVVCQGRTQLSGKLGLEAELAVTQQTPLENTEPDLDLVEPTAVLGRVVDLMPVFRIGKKRPTLAAGAQTLRIKAETRQPGNGAAQLQTPVRVQIVHHPVEAFDVGELLGHRQHSM